jgi:hypothetical protein
MAKSYEQKMKAYRSICINHAQLNVVYVKYEIASERPASAGKLAKDAATWAFNAYPELREE